MVQHREGTVRRHVVTQKTLCFMPCHSCCQPQLQFAVEAVKSSTSLASHFCKNTYSTILASQMHVDLHTSPANTTGFAQDQSYRVKAMISHCLHENTKHLENMHSTPQPFVYNTAPHHVFLPREIKHKNESYSQKKKNPYSSQRCPIKKMMDAGALPEGAAFLSSTSAALVADRTTGGT